MGTGLKGVSLSARLWRINHMLARSPAGVHRPAILPAHWLLLLRACVLASVVSDSLWPCGLGSARLLCPWGSPARILKRVAFPPPGDLSDPGLEPVSAALQQIIYHWAIRKALPFPSILPPSFFLCSFLQRGQRTCCEGSADSWEYHRWTQNLELETTIVTSWDRTRRCLMSFRFDVFLLKICHGEKLHPVRNAVRVLRPLICLWQTH